MTALLRRTYVLRQAGAAGGLHYGNSIQMEATRRKKLEESSRTRYVVVQETSTARETGRAIGIDLGTTNSCMCYIDEATKRPKIIPSPTGSWVFPTAITFDKNHEVRLFGEEARACVRASASATLCSGKRLIGRGFGELGGVHSTMSKTNILTVNEKGEVAVEIMGRTYTVVHVIAMFLRYLKNEAEKFLKEPVNLAVVSVPAYFTPQQKVATEDAALAAGFDVLEIIDEPSAACLTYTVLSKIKAATDNTSSSSSTGVERSLVFDLGGGTLDCAIMEHNPVRERYTLVATHGDPLLGGNDWDTILAQYFGRQYETKWRIPIEDADGNIAQGVAAHRNLFIEAEKAKIHFTHSTETYHGYHRAFHFSEKLRDIVPLEATLSHEDYVGMTRPLRVRCLECIERLLAETKTKREDISHVLLVGAMTRDPPIRHMLEEYFDQAVAPESTCPADYAVAIGAGLRCGMLQGKFPDLTANTRFVSGTVQSLRHSGLLRRGWHRLRSMANPFNPNAIGQRWRGKAKGLSDEEIASYAKELVEFEAACNRRLLLERAEDQANAVMRRVAADTNKKQGMQEKRVNQLAEQLKFWQYLVHHFHDHEEELLRTVKELEDAMDELDGFAVDATLNATGTIDFTTLAKKAVNAALGKTPAEEEEDQRKEATAPPTTKPEKSSVTASEGGPKILRRTAPLPSQSSEAQELVEAGHPALRRTDVQLSESTRASFIADQVEERAWREPPVPPGERGSWQEMKQALDAGEVVGAPISLEELQRPMTMEEMLAVLHRDHPVDEPYSPEHARKFDEDRALRCATLVSGAVDMIAIQEALDAEDSANMQEQQDAMKAIKDKGVELSARMHR